MPDDLTGLRRVTQVCNLPYRRFSTGKPFK
jgi:hypothetical protein